VQSFGCFNADVRVQPPLILGEVGLSGPGEVTGFVGHGNLTTKSCATSKAWSDVATGDLPYDSTSDLVQQRPLAEWPRVVDFHHRLKTVQIERGLQRERLKLTPRLSLHGVNVYCASQLHLEDFRTLVDGLANPPHASATNGAPVRLLNVSIILCGTSRAPGAALRELLGRAFKVSAQFRDGWQHAYRAPLFA
jgi:hypothetical protein